MEAAFSSDLTAELTAMERIALALDELPDEAARLRVVRWALERFCPAAAAHPDLPATARLEPVVAGPDTQLEVGDLREFFVDHTVDPDAERERPAVKEPLEAMVKGFVADFQRVADEWQGT